MTKRAERLYNCITDVGDGFLREVEEFEPRKKVAAIKWQRWASLAAAVLLVFGAGRWILDGGPKMGSPAPEAARPDVEAPAASAPASSAPQEGEPECSPGDSPYGDNGSGAAEQDWGITLSVEDLTPGGMTLVCTQSGGRPTGELETGQPFGLERREDGAWVPVDPQADVIFTSEAWLVPLEDRVSWKVDWTWLYGELPEGEYRLSKGVQAYRGPGDYDTQTYYAEFVIE